MITSRKSNNCVKWLKSIHAVVAAHRSVHAARNFGRPNRISLRDGARLLLAWRVCFAMQGTNSVSTKVSSMPNARIYQIPKNAMPADIRLQPVW